MLQFCHTPLAVAIDLLSARTHDYTNIAGLELYKFNFLFSRVLMPRFWCRRIHCVVFSKVFYSRHGINSVTLLLVDINCWKLIK